MADGPATVHPPAGPVYRVGRSPDPFAPPDWAFAQPNGTFGGRFDDSSARRGIPPSGRFRTLYFAGTPAGTFAEVLAHFRPDLTVLAAIGSVGQTPGIVPGGWRAVRRLGATILSPRIPFVDLGDARTLRALRPALAPIAVELGLPDIDLGAVTGPSRLFTQEAARFIHEQYDRAGRAQYAGIRYTSRLDRTWECWAVFDDRLRHQVTRVDAIGARDPGLLEAARVLGLRVS